MTTTNTILIKRSSTAGNVPTTGQLSLGELALNTYDGKLFTLQNNGTAKVIQLGDLGAAAPLTGFASTTGTVSSSDTILTAIEKLAGTVSSGGGGSVSGLSGLGTGVASALGTSVTGSGSIVLMNGATMSGATINSSTFSSPTLVAPVLGTPSSGSLVNCTGLPVQNITGFGTGVLSALTTSVTGSGSIVSMNNSTLSYATINSSTLSSPTLISPTLGTPSSGSLVNCTGLPVGNVTGYGTGVLSALTTSVTGSGSLALAVGATISGATINSSTLSSPTMVAPVLGTPSSGNLVNCTGYTYANLSGTLPSSAVLDTVLAGFASTTGTVFSSDTLLVALEKIVGNVTAAAPPAPGSGKLLQTVASAVAAQTGTTTLTLANTTPTTSMGTQIWTSSITPGATTSKIFLSGSFLFDCLTVSRELISMVFRGTTCIGVTRNTLVVKGLCVPVMLSFVDAPASTSAQTYSIRVALTNSSTWYVNQSSTAAQFNGLLASSSILLQELA